MSDEGAGLRRSALVMTRWPALVKVLRRATLARSVHAPACPASDGVAGAVQGVVVAQALVPDAANHLAGKVANLALQGEAHVGSAGEGELQQLGLIGGDRHSQARVGDYTARYTRRDGASAGVDQNRVG